MSKGRPMVKNRAAKMAARAIKSEQGIDYPRALAQVTETRDLNLVLGTDPAGALVRWNCLPKAHNLSIQGAGGSGKSTLLKDLASQAAAHADVYACFEGSDSLSGLRKSATDAERTWALLLEVRKLVAAILTEAREYAASRVPAGESRNSLKANVARQRADVGLLPRDRRPRQAIVFIDDFDVLCRTWEWDGVSIADAGGPGALIAQLTMDGRAAKTSVVIAGRSLNTGRGTGLRLSEKLLLGPATLAEREAFLDSEVAELEIGPYEAIFDPGTYEPIVIHLGRP